MMKKVEIITLHYISNYGSVLQTFATQKKFEQMGYSTEVVNYIRPNATPKELIKSGLKQKNYTNPVKIASYRIIKSTENRFRNRVCAKFLKKYVHMSKKYAAYEELKQDPPIADIYVTGSDQTWNSEYNGGVLPAYYLDFAPQGKKKIGYSVSIGMPEIPENEYEETRKYVTQYDAISVREDSAKKILEQMGCRNVEHILDPTLVLNEKDWSDFVAPRMIKEKYILVYKLHYDQMIDIYAEKLSEKTGYRVVKMTYFFSHMKGNGKTIFCPEVGQFLSLIKNAEHVITDSFHCTAFSLNFKKDFFVVYPGKYSTRLHSILSLTGTEHRVVKDLSFHPQRIDFEYVDRKLNEERVKVDAFIRKYC